MARSVLGTQRIWQGISAHTHRATKIKETDKITHRTHFWEEQGEQVSNLDTYSSLTRLVILSTFVLTSLNV